MSVSNLAPVVIDDSPSLPLIKGIDYGNRNYGNPLSGIFQNMGPNEVYIGGSGVTSSTGIMLLANESMPFELTGLDEYWVVCATGENAVVRIMVTRV